MKPFITYLTFDGNCREAMKFYERCFAAELQLMPFSEMPGEVPKDAKDRVMHGRLAKNDVVLLMASDSMPGMPIRQGSNFSINVPCDSVEEIERLFAAVGEEGKVTMALQDTFWGARFGMLTDRFGINWMFNFEKPQQQ
jgi:PhnB protein